MRRSGWAWIVVAIVAGLAAAPTLNAAAQAETASAPAGAGAAPPEAAGHVSFVGHNIFGSAHGVFHEWRIVEQSVDLAHPTESRVAVEVTLASVDTKSEGRDDHLRTADFFDVEKFPIAIVRGHSPRAIAPAASGHPRYAVKLAVDLHGVTKTLEGEVEIVGTNPVVVEGGFTILRTDFGIGDAPSRWNPMSIDDEVPVRFRIRF